MNYQQCWWSFLQNRTWAKLAQHIWVFSEYGPQLFLKCRIFYNATGGRFHSSVCNIWQHWEASTCLRAWSTGTYPGTRFTFYAITPQPIQPTGARTRGIYSWKLYLLTSLLGKVPSSLYSSQGYPLEATKSKTTCSLLLARKRRSKNSPLGVRMRSLLTDSVLSSFGSGGKDCSRDSLMAWGRKNNHFSLQCQQQKKGRKIFFLFLLELQDVSQCSRAFISQWQNNFYLLLNNSPADN